MMAALSLPRLVFGAGSLAALPAELALLSVRRPLLISDRGLERAGLVARVQTVVPDMALFIDVPENPTAAGADGALGAYRAAGCDGIVGLGGGSVLDTAKIVAALAATQLGGAAALIGKADLIHAAAPLIAIPTTVGTGSESSPVAALHFDACGPGVATRHPLLVPRVALCDAELARTLPRRLIAATAIDALSHCIEGFFAEPANPIIDALALDGIARVIADIHAALEPDGDAARGSLMAAAFAGGAAIHKGLGPAHAIALVCGEQEVHHGTLIGVVLPHTTRLLAQHVPDKGALVRRAMGLAAGADIGAALQALIAGLGLPVTLGQAGYRLGPLEPLIEAMAASHFNRTSPYAPGAAEYRALMAAIAPPEAPAA